MDHLRRDEIWNELKDYQGKLKLGFASVTVDDVLELIAANATAERELERLRDAMQEVAYAVGKATPLTSPPSNNSMEQGATN